MSDISEWCWTCHVELGLGYCKACSSVVFFEATDDPWCDNCQTDLGCGDCSVCVAVKTQIFLDGIEEATR